MIRGMIRGITVDGTLPGITVAGIHRGIIVVGIHRGTMVVMEAITVAITMGITTEDIMAWNAADRGEVPEFIGAHPTVELPRQVAQDVLAVRATAEVPLQDEVHRRIAEPHLRVAVHLARVSLTAMVVCTIPEVGA